MAYSIDLGAWNAVFAVPCAVVDKHIKLAGAVQLKVLLWMLRHAGEPLEAETIASALGLQRADICDAMLYWQEAGLVRLDEGTAKPAQANAVSDPAGQKDLFGNSIKTPAISPEPESPAMPQEPEKPHHVMSRPQKPDNVFVARRINESPEIAFLVQETQRILGRLISDGDSATLLMIHDDFGLPTDVILMLIQYAVSMEKGNMRYIEKVAINWADEEIFTHEKAVEKLQRLAEVKKAWGLVEKAVGIPHRSPTSREDAYASRWVLEWKFSAAMIREAYERTVDRTGKFSTGYMNRILERWHKEGISTPEQAAAEQEKKAAAQKKTEERKITYDLEEYERTSFYDTMDKE